MELSDEALVLARRRGDASAWEMLVRRYDVCQLTLPAEAAAHSRHRGILMYFRPARMFC
jgi:hypothetical protein